MLSPSLEVLYLSLSHPAPRPRYRNLSLPLPPSPGTKAQVQELERQALNGLHEGDGVGVTEGVGELPKEERKHGQEGTVSHGREEGDGHRDLVHAISSAAHMKWGRRFGAWKGHEKPVSQVGHSSLRNTRAVLR